ncbi:probable prolyl 4-hydroxylase 6 isoform X1 [Hordeum vulgare subsp. vulgare]|uniref:probable prolyl 4-hydroxylase 6 isoform X1 n=1 Tax=Hordeum vulgare subsp. vulgare TaxID=112509 RepID=UPI001D1A3B53|nr:probable prolyl 4-hydroxylase 6 isoform X1 [Hordeum vulgare subsp. vulgare]
MAPLLQRVLLALAVLLLASTASSSATASGGVHFDPTRAVHVSWRPRAFLYKGFLTEAECDHLVALAEEGGLQKSMVVDRQTGKSVMSEVRTSSGTFLAKKQDQVVATIEARIAAWTLLPQGMLCFLQWTETELDARCISISFSNCNVWAENGESIQVLRYENGQKYEPHVDFIRHAAKGHHSRGGHRVATVLMYLSDVKMGGETVFPNSDAKTLQPKDDTQSECARRGYAVKPVKGDAVLFFSLHPNGTTDPDSLHGSCPVIEGEKWSATKWIHVRPFDNRRRVPSTAGCGDDDELCPRLAANGECARNPRYMVGTAGSPGFCRKSCNACTGTTL